MWDLMMDPHVSTLHEARSAVSLLNADEWMILEDDAGATVDRQPHQPQLQSKPQLQSSPICNPHRHLQIPPTTPTPHNSNPSLNLSPPTPNLKPITNLNPSFILMPTPTLVLSVDRRRFDYA